MPLPKFKQIPDFFDDRLPTFAIGQRVRHKTYGYRGIVVDFDVTCHADDEWYRSNKTQPDRDQPWYHVLVHNSAGNTYAAEESLVPDVSQEPIAHPLIHEFFEVQAEGYDRNDLIWPSW
jgi:heat shock protein HspQ